jgi:hypothetical protein
MADIRIKDLATTAASSASDDYVAIDGASNGTRKLSAYSPTFGGNLTVSGTIGTPKTVTAGTDLGSAGPTILVHDNVNDKPYIGFYRGGTLRSVFRLNSDNDFRLLSSDLTTPSNLTIGNLTVSGGTVTSGSGTLTLNSSANTVVLQSAGTTALTLDSSQNATFAGSLQLSAAGVNHSILEGRILVWTSNGLTSGTLRAGIYATSGGNLTLATGGSLGTALSLDSSGNGSFSGTIATQGGTASTPASASASGTAGTIRWDASYIYVCTATNTWKRAAIATW